MEKSFTWITNIIESCTNDFHFSCADVLISLFKLKYANDELATELLNLRSKKWNTIHGILI